MSFAVRLTSDLAQVEAGATIPLGVEASNRSDESDTYEIQIEGLDPEWTAIPVPSFSVDAHDIHSEKVLLKPPRVTESLAGTYPFVLTLRSLKSGEIRSAQAVLEIKPFHHVSVDVTPKKGSVTPFSKECVFDVTVMNLGNSEHTLQMFASDPEDDCAIDFEPDKVTLGPGQQREVSMKASGKKRPLLANSRLHGISISARSVSVPTVGGHAQAQLEQKALIAPGAFIVLLTFLLIGIAWAIFLPKPPVMDVLTASPTQVMVGEEVTVDWRASDNTKNVRLTFGDEPPQEFAPRGPTTFIAKKSGKIQIVAIATAGDKQSMAKYAEVIVKEKPIIPLPEILEFAIIPAKASFGQPVMVRFKFSESVVKATLWPQAQDIDPTVRELEIIPVKPGNLTYTLIVENSEGKRAVAEAKVLVERSTTAKIGLFIAEPTELDSAGGVSRLTWSVTGAAYVELSFTDQDAIKVKNRVELTGSYDASLVKSTSFTLTAFDSEGLTMVKTIEVKVKPKPEPDPDPPPTTTGG